MPRRSASLGSSKSPQTLPPAGHRVPKRKKSAREEALAQRERELQILADVSAQLQAEDDPEKILDIAIEGVLSGLGLEAGWILLGDQRDRVLRLAAHRGLSPAYVTHVAKHGLSECLCPEVFSSATPMQPRNTLECPRMPLILCRGTGSSAHASIPLSLEGSARGVLNVAAPPDRLFSDGELRFLEIVGRQICLATERARHARAERLHNQEARALAALNKAIGESLDPVAVLRGIGETALGILGVDRVSIFLGSDPRHLTVSLLAGRDHADLVHGQEVDLVERDARLMRRALEEQRSFSVNDWRSDGRVNRALAERWYVGAALILPLVARKTPLGLLLLSRGVPHEWTDDQEDVAETMASQASIALENAHLYEKARRAYRELNEAQARIIQNEKMAVVGTFASGLAHEVRNPLNSIALQLSLLERRVAPLGVDISKELRDLTGVIREEVRRLDNLVGDFLQFSRTNRIQFRPTNLDLLLDEVMRLLGPEARVAGVTLRREEVGGPAPDLRVDAEKIKQVVINLVQNAIEAMAGGGLVMIESGLVEGRARIAVSDSGPGLPEGLDIFQLFVTTKAKGTGLGLSIAQQIVLEHGGEIRAEDGPEGGAVFTVLLPVARPGNEWDLM